MSLDIFTSDDEKNFHIGYFGFTKMRSLFILAQGKEKYDKYRMMIEKDVSSLYLDDLVGYSDEDWDDFYDSLGDLKILINHSDVDGELSTNECKLLKEVLVIDTDNIYNYSTSAENNPEYCDFLVGKMKEFISIVNYAAENNVKLLFG